MSLPDAKRAEDELWHDPCVTVTVGREAHADGMGDIQMSVPMPAHRKDARDVFMTTTHYSSFVMHCEYNPVAVWTTQTLPVPHLVGSVFTSAVAAIYSVAAIAFCYPCQSGPGRL